MFLSFQNFQFPLWNPAILGGIPWVSFVEDAAFYPPHYLLMLINLPFGSFPYISLEILLVGHIIFGGITMYFFCSRTGFTTVSSLVSSIIFMFGAFFLIMASHLGIVETMAWAPLIFLLVKRSIIEKKSWMPIVIPLSMSSLAGHPPTFFVILFGVFFYVVGMSVYRNNRIKIKNLLKLFFVGIITLGITGIFLIPVIEFHLESVYKFPAPGNIGFEPPVLITLLLPSFFGNTFNFGTSELSYWGPYAKGFSYMYLGIFPIILYFAYIVFILIFSAAILVQYGWGEKGEKL